MGKLAMELRPYDFFNKIMRCQECVEIVEAHIKKPDLGDFEKYDLLEVKMKLVATKQTCTYEWRINYGDSPNEYYISITDNIHPLLAFESRIEDEALIYQKDEIEEAITGLRFEADAQPKIIKNKTYYSLKPIKRIY